MGCDGIWEVKSNQEIADRLGRSISFVELVLSRSRKDKGKLSLRLGSEMLRQHDGQDGNTTDKMGWGGGWYSM